MADAELNTVDALSQLTFLVQGMLERRAAAHGMSLVQLRLLGLLRDRTPAMAELAAHLELDKSSVTGLVDRAERRGLVERFRLRPTGDRPWCGSPMAGARSSPRARNNSNRMSPSCWAC